MGKLEALQKKIDQIADNVRNLRYIIIMSPRKEINFKNIYILKW